MAYRQNDPYGRKSPTVPLSSSTVYIYFIFQNTAMTMIPTGTQNLIRVAMLVLKHTSIPIPTRCPRYHPPSNISLLSPPSPINPSNTLLRGQAFSKLRILVIPMLGKS